MNIQNTLLAGALLLAATVPLPSQAGLTIEAEKKEPKTEDVQENKTPEIDTVEEVRTLVDNAVKSPKARHLTVAAVIDSSRNTRMTDVVLIADNTLCRKTKGANGVLLNNMKNETLGLVTIRWTRTCKGEKTKVDPEVEIVVSGQEHYDELSQGWQTLRRRVDSQ